MSFGKQVGRFTSGAEKKMILTFRDSAKEVADRANENYNKGGRRPVDLGFLGASQAGSLGSMPRGQSTNKERERYSDGDHVGEPPVVTIARWQPGQTLYIGWTAVYARAMNAKFGFLQGAAEKWEQIVAKNAKRRS